LAPAPEYAGKASARANLRKHEFDIDSCSSLQWNLFLDAPREVSGTSGEKEVSRGF